MIYFNFRRLRLHGGVTITGMSFKSRDDGSAPDHYSCTVFHSSQPKATHFLRYWLNSIPFPDNRSNYAFISGSRISRDYLCCPKRGNFLVSFVTRLVAF